MKSLASFLPPKDTFNLTLTSKTIHAALRDDETRWQRDYCDGFGLKCRTNFVIARRGEDDAAKQPYWRHREIAACGAENKDVKVQLCEDCGFKTCNECRLHPAYTTMLDYSSNVPNGAALLTHARHILDPENYSNYRYRFDFQVDMPGVIPPHGTLGDEDDLKECTYAVLIPEKNVEQMECTAQASLSLDLGVCDVIGQSDLGAILTARRKRYVCGPCTTNHGLGLDKADKVILDTVKAGGHECHCTLKSHCEDRWTCWWCAVVQHRRDKAYTAQHYKGPLGFHHDLRGAHVKCACGTTLRPENDYTIFCSWCGGDISARRRKDST